MQGALLKQLFGKQRVKERHSAPLSHQWKGDNAPYLLLMGSVLGQVTQLCAYELCMWHPKQPGKRLCSKKVFPLLLNHLIQSIKNQIKLNKQKDSQKTKELKHRNRYELIYTASSAEMPSNAHGTFWNCFCTRRFGSGKSYTDCTIRWSDFCFPNYKTNQLCYWRQSHHPCCKYYVVFS